MTLPQTRTCPGRPAPHCHPQCLVGRDTGHLFPQHRDTGRLFPQQGLAREGPASSQERCLQEHLWVGRVQAVLQPAQGGQQPPHTPPAGRASCPVLAQGGALIRSGGTSGLFCPPHHHGSQSSTWLGRLQSTRCCSVSSHPHTLFCIED